MSNVLLVALFGILVFQKGSSPAREFMPYLSIVSFFVLYITIVTSVVTIANFDIPMLLYAAYYIFNLILFYVALSLYSKHRDHFLWITVIGLLISLLLQCACVILLSTDSERASAGFDNPNALGYFGLLAASSIFALSPKLRIPLGLYLIATAASFYLVVRSVSKAAMVSLLVVFIIGFWKKPFVAFLLVICSMAIIHLRGIDLMESIPQLDAARTRLEKTGRERDDSMAGRGYDRIFRHPQYLIFGAGEGGPYRFESKHYGEIHSTLGTLFFCYGVVGLGIFLYLMYKLLRTIPLYSFLFMAAPMLYGLTHQGLRFSLFWLFLALLACTRITKPKRRLS